MKLKESIKSKHKNFIITLYPTSSNVFLSGSKGNLLYIYIIL